MPLTNRQYDLLMEEYADRRRENTDETNRRRREIYEKIPELKDLDDRVSSLAVSRARNAIFTSGDPTAILESAAAEIAQITERREALLRKAGFSPEDLEPRYTCRDCKDTGYIDNLPCHCFRQRAAELSFEAARLPMNFRSQSFSDFSLDYYSGKSSLDDDEKSPYDSAKVALGVAKGYVKGFADNRENLLLYGPPGVGKTLLSNCIARELLDRDFLVLYLSAFSLFDNLKEGTFAKPGEVPETYRMLFQCDLLIIDDLGTEFSNSLTNAEFFTLINERILYGRSTIISTNLPLSGISEMYTERLFSRFLEHYRFIHLFGKDIRLLKKLGDKH